METHFCELLWLIYPAPPPRMMNCEALPPTPPHPQTPPHCAPVRFQINELWRQLVSSELSSSSRRSHWAPQRETAAALMMCSSLTPCQIVSRQFRARAAGVPCADVLFQPHTSFPLSLLTVSRNPYTVNAPRFLEHQQIKPNQKPPNPLRPNAGLTMTTVL